MRLLKELLLLPDSCAIEGIEQHFSDLRAGVFTVYVAGEPLPENVEERMLQYKTIYKRDFHGKVQFFKFEEIK